MQSEPNYLRNVYTELNTNINMMT